MDLQMSHAGEETFVDTISASAGRNQR